MAVPDIATARSSEYRFYLAYASPRREMTTHMSDAQSTAEKIDHLRTAVFWIYEAAGSSLRAEFNNELSHPEGSVSTIDLGDAAGKYVELSQKNRENPELLRLLEGARVPSADAMTVTLRVRYTSPSK